MSMLLLATRLRAAGIKPALFAYCAAFEGWEGCCARLRRFSERCAGDSFVLVGHSLGCVLIRSVAAELERKPRSCFFLAPPSCACIAARKFSPYRWYRLLTGEMGQLLADEEFMRSLPPSDIPTKIYAGNAGPRGRFSLHGLEMNDGVLAVAETRMGTVPMRVVPSIHTFIMNSAWVARDIVEATAP
ncbi:MAG: hypothetical protein JOZ66_18100 [Hyphomicrobiales bacterium]|nr:hypothetical protein [Hyphomicrobiales bacterium]